MKRRHILWIVPWLALGLNACATFHPPGPSVPDTAKACADWRWIGISRAGVRCPEVAGWTVRPLFPQLSPVECSAPAGPGINEAIQELSRFCVYEIEGPRKFLKAPSSPPVVSGDLVRLDRDCAALSASATEKLAGDDWQSYSEKFLKQAGKPKETLKINNRLGVRLAFLDTHPTGTGAPKEYENSPHGYTLANLARQLICTEGPDEHCAAQITTRLAMPIIKFDPTKWKQSEIDTTLGGYLGMQSDLAEAIRSEVDDWWNAKQQKHLVLNLSLAWDGELFSGLDQEQIGEMQAGTQAVYRALQYAASYDVLVLAAAGNQKRAPCENIGPLLPGAWEKGERPQSCGETLKQKPIIYAVGGIRADGTPLLNARPNGMPLRAAYGENAVVPTGRPEKPPVLLTGSSVATAVASSIAAIVWDTRPDLDSQGVMEILDAREDTLDFKANFWAGSNAPPQEPLPSAHRLSLCEVLKRACAGKSDCPVQGQCPKLESLARGKNEPSGENELVLGTCQPWLYPQPERPPCPACVTDPPPTE